MKFIKKHVGCKSTCFFILKFRRLIKLKSFNDYIIHKARDEPEKVVKARFNVQKSYEEQHLVFGMGECIGSCRTAKKSPIGRKIIIDIDELEKAGLPLWLSLR